MSDPVFTLQLLYASVLFVVGLVMGSFLNVVAYRAPNGVAITHPPSTCPSCNTRIAIRDNVPILGWLLLGGKCRACHAPISLRYPLVELATGMLWGLTGWRLAGVNYGYWTNVLLGLVFLAFVSAMVITFLVDWDYQIIPDEVSLGGLAAALALSPVLPMLHHAENPESFAFFHPALDSYLGNAPSWWRALSSSLIGAAAGLVFSLAIYFLGSWAFRRQIEEARKEDPEIDSALGLGDVKLMTFFGALMGWIAVVFVFFAGSIFAAVAGSIMKLLSGSPEGEAGLRGLSNRWRSGDSVIPFGPFLVAGALLYFFCWESVVSFFVAR